MSEIVLTEQSPPSTPAAGTAILYPDSTTSQMAYKNDLGIVRSIGGGIGNSSVASQTGFAADQYLAGSNIVIPPHGLQAGTSFSWYFDVTKTAAGIATPIVSIRVGTLGTTADAAVVTFTLPAQSAVADVGLFIINAVLRNTGAAGVMVGILNLTHNVPAATAGLSTSIAPNIVTVSSGFNTTTANLIVGLSVNAGASAAWTMQQVQSTAYNI